MKMIMVLRALCAAFILFVIALITPGAAMAACGTPAKDAVYKTVTTPAQAEVTDTRTVVVTPAIPGTPAVYESVKVIDQEYQPAVPPVEEVSHIEHLLVTPGSPEVAEVSHQEYKYKKTVTDYLTQYHLAKFTRTKTKSVDVWQNFSPNKQNKKFVGPPAWPTDPRGTWQHINKPIPAGHEGPDGVYQKGTGNSSWFYRQAGVWSDWSEWTKWSPETHTSWENSDAPLGEPQYHGSGKNSDGTEWYREWQARFDGETRQVENGSHEEFYKNGDWTTDTPGDPWVKIDERKVVDTEYQPPVPPVYEDVKIIDVEAQPGKPEVPEVSHMEDVLVTPATPGSPAVTREEEYVVKEAVPASSKRVLVSSAIPAGEACATPPKTATLAFTGSEIDPILKWAFLALLIGGIAIAVGRKVDPGQE